MAPKDCRIVQADYRSQHIESDMAAVYVENLAKVKPTAPNKDLDWGNSSLWPGSRANPRYTAVAETSDQTTLADSARNEIRHPPVATLSLIHI